MSYRSMNLIEFNSSFDWEIYGIKGGRKKVASVESTWVNSRGPGDNTPDSPGRKCCVERPLRLIDLEPETFLAAIYLYDHHTHTHTPNTPSADLLLPLCYTCIISVCAAGTEFKTCPKKKRKGGNKKKYFWSVSVFWQARSACVFVMSSERMHRTGPDGTRYSFEWPRHPTG